MIIILGPDGSGKTTLTNRLSEQGLMPLHAVKETDYDDYMRLLSGEKSRPIPLNQFPFQPGALLTAGTHFVLDRWFYCEFPYSKILRQEPEMKWSLKQVHNMHLATMAHNPVVLLTTRKAQPYPADEHVPEGMFTPILNGYRQWLDFFDITYIEWDYLYPPMTIDKLVAHSLDRQSNVIWWRNMAKRGIAGYGNTIWPTTLVLAEILGGYNLYHFPFEQGPSGYYLSELLDEASIPLSSFYITNWKKTTDPAENEALLRKELFKTGVQNVIFLGRESEKALPVVISSGIEKSSTFTLPHPGWVVNHSPTPKEEKFRKVKYSKTWRETWQKALPQELTPVQKTAALEEDILIKVD